MDLNDRIRDVITCPVCQDICVCPVTMTFLCNCHQSPVCWDCAVEMRINGNGCLICKTKKHKPDFFVPNITVNSLFEQLGIVQTCCCGEEFKTSGLIIQHKRAECMTAKVKCSYRGCTYYCCRSDLFDHVNTCSFAPKCKTCKTYVYSVPLTKEDREHFFFCNKYGYNKLNFEGHIRYVTKRLANSFEHAKKNKIKFDRVFNEFSAVFSNELSKNLSSIWDKFAEKKIVITICDDLEGVEDLSVLFS